MEKKAAPKAKAESKAKAPADDTMPISARFTFQQREWLRIEARARRISMSAIIVAAVNDLKLPRRREPRPIPAINREAYGALSHLQGDIRQIKGKLHAGVPYPVDLLEKKLDETLAAVMALRNELINIWPPDEDEEADGDR